MATILGFLTGSLLAGMPLTLSSATKFLLPSLVQDKLVQLPASSGFNIYCTSNQDGTGACKRTDNNAPIRCLMIPGGVINCKQETTAPIQCVLYSSTLDSQGFFYCTRRTDPGVSNDRINQNRFANPSGGINSSHPVTPALPDSLDTGPDSPSGNSLFNAFD